MFKSLILRARCWWLGVCFTHGETMEQDIYGPRYCQMCRSDKGDTRKNHDALYHYRRMQLVHEIRKHRGWA